MAWAGGRAYQKLKADHESLVASQLHLANSMAEKWKSHDEDIRRLIESQRELTSQMIEIVRHEEKLENYHKRLQRVEDTHISVVTMANSVKEIRAKLFERK